MCYACWREDGFPQNDTAAAREAAALVVRVYEHSLVGGGLHVIVDDCNVDDEYFDHGAESFIEENIHELSEDALAVERACFAALKALTVPERWSALARAHRFPPPESVA